VNSAITSLKKLLRTEIPAYSCVSCGSTGPVRTSVVLLEDVSKTFNVGTTEQNGLNRTIDAAGRADLPLHSVAASVGGAGAHG
jgi:hypothetical protein